jgi:hypothetical protein
MEQINTITRSQYPFLFDFIGEYEDEPYHIEREHRRGSSFYVTETYWLCEDTINEFTRKFEIEENLSYLIGYWQANRLWSEDWGYDSKFDCLTRVERKVKIIEEEYFEPVQTNKSIAHA